MFVESLESRRLLAVGSEIAAALDLPTGTAVTVTGPGAASVVENRLFFNNSLLNFPTGDDGDFLILSTGNAADVTALANVSGDQGTDLGDEGEAGDTTTIEFTLPVNGEDFLSFDFVFLSEEFPEFVGSEFNDFFTVKANGNEIAEDQLGNPININNVFFDANLEATGTFFDGRTKLLRAYSTLPEGTTSVDVVISIGDISDGIYDSAALIDNIELREKQVVFLDYGASSTSYNSLAHTSPEFRATDVGLADANTVLLRSGITSRMQGLFNSFNIEVTDAQPTDGEYTTVFFGGNGIPKIAGSSILGIAEKVDIGNEEQNDDVFMFTQNFGTQTLQQAIDLLGIVAVHEVGHALGAQHLKDSVGSACVMAVTALNSTQTFCNTDLALEHSSGVQNTTLYLNSVLGLDSGSLLIPGGRTLRDEIFDFFNFKLGGAAANSTIYDVVIGVTIPGSDQPPYFVQIPEVSDGEIQVELPVFGATDQLFIAGKTIDGGEYDVFFVDDVNVDDFLFSEIGLPIKDSAGNLQPTFPLHVVSSSGSSAFGDFAAELAQTVIPSNIQIQEASGAAGDGAIVFPETPPDGQSTQTLTINNTGLGVLSVFPFEGTLADSPFSFSFIDGTPFDSKVDIQAGASTEIQVTFSPTAPGEFTEVFTISSNDVNAGSQTLTITSNSDFVNENPTGGSSAHFISPGQVTRPYLLSGDGQITALLFKTLQDTTVTVNPIGAVSFTEQIRMLDRDLNQVGGYQNGSFTADVTANGLYAILFEGADTERLFYVGSSAGFDSLAGSGTNVLQPTDTNGDGATTQSDALQVLNALASDASPSGEFAANNRSFVDVSGDGVLSPLDALIVINRLAEDYQKSALSEWIEIGPSATNRDRVFEEARSSDFHLRVPIKAFALTLVDESLITELAQSNAENASTESSSSPAIDELLSDSIQWRTDV